MKYYDITIKFTLDEIDYDTYNKYLDEAMDLILPYGKDYEVKEVDYKEEE